MELNDFGTKMYQTLNSPLITPSSINKKTIALIQSKKIRLIKDQGIQFLYTQAAVSREKEIAENIIRISHSKLKKQYSREEISSVLKNVLQSCHITLDNIQKNAVIESLYQSMLIITGGPVPEKQRSFMLSRKYIKDYIQSSNASFLRPPDVLLQKYQNPQTKMQELNILF